MSLVIKEVAVEKINVEHTLKKEGAKWPLTGGVPSHLCNSESYHVERLYVAGYQDGSVRIWDATYPALSLIYAIGPEVGMLSQFLSSLHKQFLYYEIHNIHLTVYLRINLRRPIFLFLREWKVTGIRSTGANGTVSALEFCSLTLGLAVGDVCGLVRVS